LKFGRGKYRLFFTAYLFFCSCGPEKINDTENHAQQPVVFDTMRSELEADSLSSNAELLKSVLENPIDLVAFKAEYGPANSGGTNGDSLFDLPETTGFLYCYMLFQKLRSALPSHPSESELFHNFRITVFKYGSKVGAYNDTNEVLMAIECGLDNTMLNQLNVYGLTREEVTQRFGEPQFILKMGAIYAIENKVLSVHFNLTTKTVDWYKYARLNPSINLYERIPHFLLSFDN